MGTPEDRVDDVVRRVNRALVRADDRAELEAAVVDILTASDLYRFAWLGEYDQAAGTVEPRAHAGAEAGESYLTDLVVTDDPDDPEGQGPGGEALRTGEVAVAEDVAEDPGFAPWREAALERSFRSVAAVPLVAAGEVVGLLGVYADRPGAFAAAERQELAEVGANVGHAVAAREHERELERYRMLVETVGDPMYVLDAEGHVEMLNEAMAATLGREREALLGEHVSSFMPEADVRRGTETLLALVEDPERRWASFEMDVVRADGERIHCEDRVAALVEDGELAGSVGVVRDITERVRERERLEALTTKVERLHAVATELQTASDTKAVCEHAVAAAEDILGFDWCVAALAREGWFELVAVSAAAPVEVGERHLRVDEGIAGAAFQAGESMLTDDAAEDDVSEPADESFVASLVVPMGEFGVFQANAAEPGYFDGRDLELAELLVAHVTEALHRIDRESAIRERDRELQRQNERLERFASVVSHDLRNPLNLADGRLELARAAVDDGSEAAEHLAEVDWALDRIDRLIDEVLTLAREGQTPDDTAPVDLADAVADAWATTAEGEAELVMPADPGAVVADRDRLVRLLENLFRNAVEHAGPDPRVAVGPTEDGFYVADDGPGVPAAERDRVFESGYTTDDDGTGFGLAIVRELAAAHGWEVALAESEAGGARFEFRGVDVGDGA